MTTSKASSNGPGNRPRAQVDATAEQIRRLVAKLKEKDTSKTKTAAK